MFVNAGGYSAELAEFTVGVFLQLLGLPFVAVSQVSLFSKVTAEKTQGGWSQIMQEQTQQRPSLILASFS